MKDPEVETLSASIEVAEPAASLPETVEESPVAETASEVRPEPRLPAPVRPGEGARAAYPLALIAALLWVGGVASYTAYQVGGGALELTSVNAALLTLVALAPAGLVLVVAHMMRQAAALAAEARRARAMADMLGLPTGVAVQETGQVLVGLRSDIDLSAQAAESARVELAALRGAMEEETRRLNEAAETAQRTARRLADQLAKERLELTDIGRKLETQTQDVIETVERQARMVADASDLAQTQLREAEAALAARAADMATAAGEAQDAARAAADDLSRQTMRLETAGSGVADQIRSVEEGLSEQRAALVQAAFGLRRDQEDFSAQVETQRAQLIESLGQTRVANGEMADGAVQGAQSLQALLEAATDQVKALSDLAANEANTFDARTREALDRFEDMAAQARQTAMAESEQTLAMLQAALAEARATSDDAVTEVRERVERLGEAAFEAGKAADQAAEMRLEAARRVVDDTASMGEEAGQRIAERLEASLSDARATLAEIEGALGKIDERAARLPAEAKARAEEVRESVEQSLHALIEASRKAAEETAAVDAAFQERVRRNYDMLTEAVRLMGVVSGEPAVGAARREAARGPEPIESPAREAGLRGRLRLTPTHRDEEVRRTFETGDPAPLAETAEPMSWRDLLAGTGEPALDASPEPEPRETADLTNRLTAAILDLGVDPSALLPRARVEEAASAFQALDTERAREITRRVAPAAVRRISRRVLSDRPLRGDVDRFVRHYGQSLKGAAERGESVGPLLGTDAGRAFLLLDAAVGDLG